MRRRLILSAATFILTSLAARGQWALKNNLLYDACLTWNLGTECRIKPQWTLGLSLGYSPYRVGTTSTKRWRHVLVVPQARYWFCEPYARHFIGMNVAYSHFNVSRLKIPFFHTGDYRYQGDFVGAGVSYGYALAIGRRKHWNVEFEVGADLCHAWYDKYRCEHCGSEVGPGTKWFVMPRLGLNLAWILPGEYFNPGRMQACKPAPPPAPEPVPMPVPEPVFQPQLGFVAEDIGTAGRLQPHHPILAPITDYVPYTPNRVLRKEGNALYVHFPLDRSVLDADFRQNRAVLDSILSVTRQLMADSISGVRRIAIVGMASVEGPQERNCALGEARAQALKQFLQDRLPLADSLFVLSNACEAWGEFRDQLSDIRTLKQGGKVQALPGSPAAEMLRALTPEMLQGISLEEVEEVIRIVDEEEDPAVREQRIRWLNSGRTYDFLRQNILADQRNSGYLRVYFDYLPDRAAQDINQAIAYVRQQRYADALHLLLPHASDARAWNAMGVAYLRMGNLEQAQYHLERAAARGEVAAAENLKQLERIREVRRQNRMLNERTY